MLTEDRKAQVIELCRTLIKKKSYSGEEDGVAEEIKLFCTNHGFDSITCDEYGNIMACIKGKYSGKKILFDGHMDTVPIGNESDWKYPPFAAKINDNKIYGRGASDMKGAIAAFICAASNFAKDTKREFAGDIYIAGVVHEECFEGIAARSIAQQIKPDYVIIGEASNLDLKIGQRGRGEIKIETFGVPAHSANPEKGINAVYKMCYLVDKIKKLPPTEHSVLGKGILELTDIKSSPYPGASVVPEYCMATYDRRLLVGETRESVLAPLQDIINEAIKEDKSLKARVSFATGQEKCYTGNMIEGERFFPGWLFNENENFIQDILNELRKNGFTPQVREYNFCTNGSCYAGEMGIKTIGMGPSVESLAHTINEYIEISQLTTVTECYYHIMKALTRRTL